ncbi:conserved hypothetical protein [Candidatus Methylobacter favarea]|uniref:Cytochrome C oxidase subunit I n=1 Tax=Candidatus Methylobacter favarea TaxID=2707345 RepID=A0A8S0X2B5_9GAMM|nr:hypothetical protein [Candidatus Methylobacter favarea]CAA9891772.1 conserved hypothetical protein [Candidatus Methylobacter favarea]
MANQQKKNRLLILGIFGMSIIPFLIAWGIRQNPEILTGRTNKGQLITPPVPTERNDLTGFDQFSADNMAELFGHWLIVNVITDTDCNDKCQEAIYKTRQLQLMMSKDLTRTRRIVLIFKEVDPEIADHWWPEDRFLLKVKPSDALVEKITEIRQGAIPDGMLFLMDPLGNLMMQYESGFDPYKVKSDLTHLLRVSQIG